MLFDLLHAVVFDLQLIIGLTIYLLFDLELILLFGLKLVVGYGLFGLFGLNYDSFRLVRLNEALDYNLAFLMCLILNSTIIVYSY